MTYPSYDYEQLKQHLDELKMNPTSSKTTIEIIERRLRLMP